MSPLISSRSFPRARIATGFGLGATLYEETAEVQRHAASGLALEIASLMGEIPEGPILEVGCGTGFLTRHLARLFPDRALEITDLSEGMLSLCRTHIPTHPGGISFHLADAEEIDTPNRYALVTAGFVGQWFREPVRGLLNLTRLLRPGGVVAASVPGRGSFPELRQASEEAGYNYPGMELPDAGEIQAEASRIGIMCRVVSSYATEHYPSSLDFLRHLRDIGAAPSDHHPRLSPSALREILRRMDNSLFGSRLPGVMTTVTYEVHYLLLLRPESPSDQGGLLPVREG